MDQPNILLIMCDQLAPQFTGAYGHSVVQTPHLDQLAAEGVRFDAAYTSCPLCAPARHSLMSGQYISRIKCWDNSSPLASDTPTVAHYLSAAGYETALSGKMHFVGPDQLHGFEKRLTTDIFPSDYTWLPGRPRDGWANFGDTHAQPIAIDYVTSGPRQWSMQLDFDEEVHFRALEYLRGKRSLYTGSLQRDLPLRDERPFFLCVSYSHPHEPFHPTSELWNLYADAEIDLPEMPEDLAQREHPIDAILNAYHGTHRVDLDNSQNLYNMRRAYYAQTTYIDRNVGELLQALETYGLRENMLVVFISDHGEMLGERRMIQKRSHYEYSARVPWIMAHPAVWPGGVVVPEPVSLVDLLPTLLACAGIDPSELTPIDGRDVSALMAGARDPDRAVFCESHAGGMTTTTFMVRQGRYKYILASGYAPQLYDLVDDPREWHNLADDPTYAGVATRLRDLILAEFDPARIDSEIEASLARRRVIRRAMKTTNQPRWDYQPVFDATQQYWRSG